MKTGLIFAPITLAALTLSLGAQNLDRGAEMMGNGDPNHGKCTIEVVVDGAVEIQIRGNTASMHNLAGQAPQWRRFQCTGVMPANPGSFRFAGVDGRGRQELIQYPRNGGAATVRIEDPAGGAEGYTFDLIWDNQAPGQNFPGPQGRDSNNGQQQRRDNVPPGPAFNTDQRRRDFNNGRDFNSDQQQRDRDFNNGQQGRDRGFDGRPGFDSRPGDRISNEQAVRNCQDSIRQEAMQRFGNVNLTFRQTNLDNSRGADGLTGAVVVSRPWYSRNEVYPFSCSVDYETGRLRTAHLGVPNN